MKEILKAIDLLDSIGQYKYADAMLTAFKKNYVKIAAMPYNQDLSSLPLDARSVSWEKNKEDYQQYDDLFWKEFKQRIPDYMQLNTDSDEEYNLEGSIHNTKDQLGVAYNPSGDEGTSPSQSTLGDFDWDTIRDTNNDPEGWVNLQPRR